MQTELEQQRLKYSVLRDQLRKLQLDGLSFSDCVKMFGEDRETDPVALRAIANHEREGEIEFDDFVVSSESDGGAYVMAWIWSPHQESA